VHQHKLLEGVDGPSFRALAFYGVLGSARALVQQIGRVIRNPLRDRAEKALLIDHSDGFIADMWRRFREYDASIDEKNLKLGLDDFAKSFEANLPPVVYADRQFRRRFGFNMTEADARRSLRLPLRCHLYEIKHRGAMKALAAITQERLAEAEYPFQMIVGSDDELLILFVKLGTSPLLAEHFFIERELHAFVARKLGSVMAVLDTSRAGLESRARAVVGRPLSRRRMNRLLSKSPDTRLVEIISRNAALGPSAVRRRSATAASLEETPPALDEFQFMASSITAADSKSDDIDSFSFRSVGFGMGRISDESARRTLELWGGLDRVADRGGIRCDASGACVSRSFCSAARWPATAPMAQERPARLGRSQTALPVASGRSCHGDRRRLSRVQTAPRKLLERSSRFPLDRQRSRMQR
jgi:hypothetical protein